MHTTENDRNSIPAIKSRTKEKLSVFFAFLLSFLFIFYSNVDHAIVPASADGEPFVIGIDASDDEGQTFSLVSLDIDNEVEINVEFSVPVAVAGTPGILLNVDGISDIYAEYDEGADIPGDAIVPFVYTVEEGQYAEILDWGTGTVISLNGGSITDIPVDENSPIEALLDLSAANLAGAGIIIDTVAPGLEFSTTFGAATNVSAFQVALSFDETPVLFDIESDLVIEGGTLASAPTLSGNTYTLSIVSAVAESDGHTIALSVSEGAYEDANGNANRAASFDVLFDTVAPVAEIVGHVAEHVNDTTPSFAFESDEAGAIEFVSGACETSDQALAGATTMAAMLPLDDGEYADCSFVVRDEAGNESMPVALAPFSIDTAAPTADISFGIDGNTAYANDDTVVTVSFSEAPRLTLPTDIIISEIAWKGYDGDEASEWIELYNRGAEAIDLAGWTIQAFDGEPDIALEGMIPAYGFFLLERDADTAVPDVSADQIYEGALVNSGEVLALLDGEGRIIDSIIAVSGWPADATASGETMQWNDTEWVTASGTPKSLNAGATAVTPASDGIWSMSDIAVSNGSIMTGTFTQDADDPRVFRFIVDPVAEGSVSVSIAGGVFADLASNANEDAFENSFIYDVTPPVIVIDPLYVFPPLWNEDTVPYDITIAEANDIATASSVSCPIEDGALENGANTIILGPFEDGLHNDCDITITDAAGNESVTILSVPDFTVDTTAPVATVEFEAGEFTNADTFTARITMSEPVLGFDISDIISDNSNATIVSGSFAADPDEANVYTVTIDTIAEGPMTIRIPGGSFADSAGNENDADSAASAEYDATSPGVSIISPIPTLTNDATPSVTIDSTEAGTAAFASGDACAFSSGAIDAGEATLDLAALASGTYACSVVVVDRAGNASAPAALPQFTIDVDAPTAVFSASGGATDINGPVAVTMTVSNDAVLANISAEDIAVTTSNATIDGFAQIGSSGAFSFTLTPAGSGIPGETITIGIAAGAFLDFAGNASAAHAADFSYERVLPVLTLVAPIPALGNDPTPSLVLRSTEPGTLSFTGGCSAPSGIAAADTDTVVTLDALADDTYDCTVTLADAHGNASEPISIPSFYIDTVPPGATFSASASAFNGPFTVTLSVAADADLSMIDASDVSVSANAAISEFAHSAGTDSFTFLVTPTTPGAVTEDVTISMPAGAFADDAGNASAAAPALVVSYDTIAPSIAETAGIALVGGDAAPAYSFTSTEAGSLAFSGGCAAAGSASVGANTITLAALPDGIYSCTLAVADAAGNASAALSLAEGEAAEFEIDTVSPSVVLSTPDDSVNGSFDVTAAWSEEVAGFDEADIVVTNGAIVSGTFALGSDGLTYSFSVAPSGDGTIGVSIAPASASDHAGNANASGAALSVESDTTAPALSLISGVPSVSSDSTPDITISSGEAGTLILTGACAGTTHAIGAPGTVTVAIGPLSDGEYGDCGMRAEDAYGNQSPIVPLPSFVIDAVVPSVTSVYAAENGRYEYSEETIEIRIEFTEDVFVAGTPRLALSPGIIAVYEGGSGTETLRFAFVTEVGQQTDDLEYESQDALSLGDDGAIRDAAGNDASLTLPVPGADGSLSENSAVRLDVDGTPDDRPGPSGGGSVGRFIRGIFAPADEAETDAETLADRIRDFIDAFDAADEAPLPADDPADESPVQDAADDPADPADDAPAAEDDTPDFGEEVADAPRGRETLYSRLLAGGELGARRTIADLFAPIFSRSVDPNDMSGNESLPRSEYDRAALPQTASAADALSSGSALRDAIASFVDGARMAISELVRSIASFLFTALR